MNEKLHVVCVAHSSFLREAVDWFIFLFLLLLSYGIFLVLQGIIGRESRRYKRILRLLGAELMLVKFQDHDCAASSGVKSFEICLHFQFDFHFLLDN